MPRRAFTGTAVALLLALTPAGALAQGAGDDQYQDPLAPTAPKQQTQTTTTPAPTTTTPAQTTAPASTTSTPVAAAAPTASSSQELPRTGAPAGLIGLGGAALIASGAALRRRTAPR